MGSGTQRDIARADDERAVRGRSAHGRAVTCHPALGERRPSDSDATAPTASPTEAQRTRLAGAGTPEPEPKLRARLEDAGAAESESPAAPCSVCCETRRYSAVYKPFLAQKYGNISLKSSLASRYSFFCSLDLNEHSE
jgi:hypothetical protein